MPCIDEDVALAVVKGEPAAPGVTAHLVACEACRAFVAGLARVLVPDATGSPGGWGGEWVRGPGQLQLGTRLGEYVLEEVLGRGGMGIVIRAHDERLDRQVATKVLRDDFGPRRLAWLRREAASMAKLAHPNVAAVFDFGESEHGPYVVMELVRGRTLSSWVASSPGVEAIVQAYSRAAEGLHAAHEAGIVHRDFKPSNAMITLEPDAGRVKVLDFGLSTAFEVGSMSDADAGSSSTLGGAGGTPRYASPEQFAGGPISPRSDQFSFCVALFEALCGAPPFSGATGSERRTAMLVGRMRTLPGEVPEPVARALSRGLSLDPDRRFPTMDALAVALRHRPRALAPLMAVAAVMALGGWGLWPTAETPCSDGTDRMQRAWPRPRPPEWTSRAGVRSHAARLDDYVDEWLGARATLCASRRTDRVRFEAQAACLERLASRIDRVAERLVQLASDEGPLPSNLFGDLDAPSSCRDAEIEGTYQPLRDEFETLRERGEHAEADGTLSAAERDSLAAEAWTLWRRAEELGDTRVQGMLANLLGVTAMVGGEFEEAEQRLAEAFFLAELAGDEATQLEASSNLEKLFSEYYAEPDRAWYWAQRVAAAGQRIGTEDAIARGALAQASALVAGRDAEASLAYFEAAQGQLRYEVDARHLHKRRAEAFMALQKRELARAEILEVIAGIERDLGPNHPDLAAPLNMLAINEIIDANYEDAMGLLERVVALTPETDRMRRALVQGNLAILFMRTGRATRALDTFREIQVVFEETLGPEHPTSIANRLGLLEALASLGRRDEALREVERLMSRGLDQEFLSRALFVRASVVDDPRPDLERILTLPDEPASTYEAAREALASL